MNNPECGFPPWSSWGILAEAEIDREREELRNEDYFSTKIANNPSLIGKTVVIADQRVITFSDHESPRFLEEARRLVKGMGLDSASAIVRKIPDKPLL